MALPFNPFSVYSINQYNQYKDCPFLQTRATNLIKNNVMGQIRDKYTNPERLLLLGERGLGKTTSLFFVKDMLENAGYKNVFFLTKLVLDNDCLRLLTGKSLKDFSEEKGFLLIDFPDTTNLANLKKFLEFIWEIMTSPFYKNINLIFSLNISHFNFISNMSEVLGKFDKIRIERMDLTETRELIDARLAMANASGFFDEEVYGCIYDYSQGIPRNIICASRGLADNFSTKDRVDLASAQRVLREVYTDKIINDRVEDPEKRAIFKRIITLIGIESGGVVETQELLSKRIKEDLNIGRNRAIGFVNELSKFGLLIITKGGENNTKKIIKLI